MLSIEPMMELKLGQYRYDQQDHNTINRTNDGIEISFFPFFFCAILLSIEPMMELK